MHRLLTRLRRGPNMQSRAGVSEMVGTIAAVPCLAVIAFTLVFYIRAWHARAAVEDTAAVGARWATTSLSGQRGCIQAMQAMDAVIGGYHLNPSTAVKTVYVVNGAGTPTGGRWGRGYKAVVQVSYVVDQSVVPIVGPLLGNPTITARFVVPIDPFNNRYEWTSCS